MTSLPILDTCWDRIGVGGDRSCPELVTHAHCRNCPVFASAARSFFDRPPPPDYVEEWTALLARAEPDSDRDHLSTVIFRLHSEWLALATTCLVEVTLPRPVHRVPQRSNRVLVGLVNIRGQLHLCVSLHGVLGIELADSVSSGELATGRQRLLVVEHRGERWVFAADEVHGVEPISRDRLRKVPGTLANPAHHFSQAVFPWQGRHVGLLDEERVLAVFRGLRMSNDLENNPLLELFRGEAESQTAALAEGLLKLERGEASAATIESMMRAAHSLKGAARIVGLDAAVRVSHVLEDYFVAVQRDQVKLVPAHIDVLLRGVDLLNQIAQWLDQGQDLAGNEPALAAYVDEVKALLAGGPPPSPPPAPATPVNGGRPSPERTVSGSEVSQGADAPRLPEPLDSVPAPTPSPAEPAPRAAEKVERVVRVTADSLTRLMGLAGESLVEARQFTPLIAALRQLKHGQVALGDSLAVLEERWPVGRDSLSAGARELLAQARAHAGRCQLLLNRRLEELEDFAHRSEDLSGRLHHEVILSRMRPLADGVRGFPRLVRDLARQLGKSIEFEVRGENTGVDRDVLDKLEAPLNHLIRNGVDHGIEMPDGRAAAGKSATGHIRLEAHHRSGMLQITLADDGRGIDPAAIRAKVVARGLATAAMAGQLSEAELFEFLFLPGFTTKEVVSEISGRGVGLDVVQSMVRGLGGSVRVTSTPGRGTTFTLRLPISMSVIRALLVEVGGEPYAFPLTRIDRIDVLAPEKIEWLEGRPFFTFDGETIGVVEAAQVLELPEEKADPRASRPVVVVSDRGHRFGLMVSRFLGERDLDVRPLDSRLGKVPNLGGASLLEDGGPVLIFDVEDLVRSIDNLLTGRRFKRPSIDHLAAQQRTVKRILVVDDSITVRELERQLLTNHGYEVDTAVDGMDGWNAVGAGEYHLVVSDVDMPRMDGIELVRRIKQDARLKSLPVVVVSYKDRGEDRLRGLDAGANCYLTKSSFHDRTFLEAVVDLIGEAR